MKFVLFFLALLLPSIAQAQLTGACPSGQFVNVVNNNIPSQACAALPAGAVSSVSNSDGTLTISPTTGVVVASLALGHANAWTGTQSFSEVLGTVTTQAGTTYTFAATDCGTEVTFSNAGAVTATIPQTLPAGCNIAVAQLGAGKVSVNGSAVAAATLHSAHSYTGTSGQWAVIGINIEANAGGNAAIALLTGDGS